MEFNETMRKPKIWIRTGLLIFVVAFVLQEHRGEVEIIRVAVGLFYAISIVCMLRGLWIRRLTKSSQ